MSRRTTYADDLVLVIKIVEGLKKETTSLERSIGVKRGKSKGLEDKND